MQARLSSAFGLVALATACGADPPPPAEMPPIEAPAEAPKRASGLSVSSEIGALDEKKTSATFDRLSGKLQACFIEGTKKLPYLAGEIRFVVRITESGAAKWAFVKESSLGDRKTEDCMLGALKATTWPQPVGGEGLAEKAFSFEPGGDERPPVSATPDQLGPPYKKAKGALKSCKASSGTAAMTATLYVGTNGKPASVGVASADEKGETAVGCVVGALSGVVFATPGSYASKVTIPID